MGSKRPELPPTDGRTAKPSAPSPEAEEALAYMESQIRDEYRSYFGTELGQ